MKNQKKMKTITQSNKVSKIKKDQYRGEIKMLTRVQDTHLYMWLKDRKSVFLSKLDDVIKYAEDMLPQINNVFATYTIHGIKHSINVMEYMNSLIEDLDKLSELEVVMLIYSAFLLVTQLVSPLI